ncbi:MAG: tRNA (adenosine(37)-N6)-threonylcarbamoyltransferase complex transferase subunit TsaD [Chloroflexi bacterium]|nr:tRNA (adenosine(37)-N6)-threonylcarbamoyltransferase complex transferase subunit TsaD [Chloroflexota bacterium]
MNILGIESSCDETAAAVIADGTVIRSNVVASQIDIHARYGGVVPEVASRQHLLSIIPVVQQAMVESKATWDEISAIAVTHGPGLAGSLLVGVSMAKALAWANNKPLIGINHLEGHIYANWLNQGKPEFPLLCLIVSGGHTDLIRMVDHGRYTMLGRSRDDAAGEAFDKVARVLGVGYPGGPSIEKAAMQARDVKTFSFTRAWMKDSYDFSFSGLKTSIVRLVASLPDPKPVAEIAAEFQKTVVDVLVTKTIEAAQKYGVKQIMLAGGVAANKMLRQTLLEKSPIPVLYPPISLCTDNAAMIASCGYFRWLRGEVAGWDLDVDPNLRLGLERD